MSAATLKICNVHSIIHTAEPAFIRAPDLSLKLLYRSAAGTVKLTVCADCALHLFHVATVCSLFSAAREHYVSTVVSYRTLQQVKIQIDAIYIEACINTTWAVRGEPSLRQSAWGHRFKQHTAHRPPRSVGGSHVSYGKRKSHKRGFSFCLHCLNVFPSYNLRRSAQKRKKNVDL